MRMPTVLVSFLLLWLSLALGAPCTVLTDPDEIASAHAAGMGCHGRTVCDNGSGTCHVTYVDTLM
jgi:hypothetical protein